MTEELLKKLHTAMLNDNEHQCNRLNNYIHTDEYLTAEVVKVVREIVADETKELREENILLKTKLDALSDGVDWKGILEKNEQVEELQALVEKYRQATDKILHITFMGGGCEVQTIGQYATLVDGYLTDVEGLAKWKE